MVTENIAAEVHNQGGRSRFIWKTECDNIMIVNSTLTAVDSILSMFKS